MWLATRAMAGSATTSEGEQAMSAWLSGPIAGPLVDGDLCELAFGDCGRCFEPAVMLAEEPSGRQVLLCGWHADRHDLDHDHHDH